MASGQTPIAVTDPRLAVAGAVVVGIVLGIGVLALTGHYTDTAKKPTREVAATSRTGAATVVLSGIGLGLESAVAVVVTLALGVYWPPSCSPTAWPASRCSSSPWPAPGC